ncbi:MAG TPA: hypothetical protein VIK60_18330 [Vicinamibacterales bacterium]
MRNRFRPSVIVSVAIVTVLVLTGTVTTGQSPTYKAPRTTDGKPNLNGVWQALNEAYWDIETHPAAPGSVTALGAAGAIPPGPGLVEGGLLPYQPAAAEQKKKNFENRLTLDPEIKCYLPGVPRANYMPYPFQIIQTPKYIMMVYTFARAVRTIYMDDHKEAPADSWMGWSNGRWEGETLVVDTTGFNGQAWFDRAGNFHSDALHVVERFTATSPDHLLYEATIEDKNVFTRPWKISMPIYRRLERNAQIMDFRCVEFAEDLIYGHLRKPSGK